MQAFIFLILIILYAAKVIIFLYVLNVVFASDRDKNLMMSECHMFNLWSSCGLSRRKSLGSCHYIRTLSCFLNEDHRRTFCNKPVQSYCSSSVMFDMINAEKVLRVTVAEPQSLSESRLVWMFWKRKWNCHMVADYIVTELFETRVCSWEIPSMWLIQLCLIVWLNFTAGLSISPHFIFYLPVAAFQ